MLLKLFKGDYSQTLMHIAATSLWILPVIASNWKVRLGYTFWSGFLHILISWWFNFVWVHSDPNGTDGGPLGFLSWSVPALAGTLACDAVRESGTRAVWRISAYGILVMAFGWLLSMGTVLYNVHTDRPIQAHSEHPLNQRLNPIRFPIDPVVPAWERLSSWDGTIVEPPFVPPPDDKHRQWNYWMMSQRGGNVSYPTFTAGLSLVIYALCLWLCDTKKWQLGTFRTLGTNSLAAYILHDIASWVVSPWFPRSLNSSLSVMTGFACSVLFVYAGCRLLERRGWYLRV